MSNTESIFKQSIRAAAFHNRVAENERLRQQMVDDINFRLRNVPLYEIILGDEKEMKTSDSLDTFDLFDRKIKYERDYVDAFLRSLPHYGKSVEKCLEEADEYIDILLRDGRIRFIKILVNGPATVLFIEGKKYVSKCHNEEFNATKGILVCIAKYLGVTHSRIKAILKRRGLANSQDAELCLLWDIADSGGFDEIAVAEMVEKAKVCDKTEEKK